MEVDEENEKKISDETSTKKNKEAMESHTKMDIVSITLSKTSVTTISTNIPWESIFFQTIF